MIIEDQPGGGPSSDSIPVHLPANPDEFHDKAVRNRRSPYFSVCRQWVKLPTTVRIKDDSDGETWIYAGPHERYHGFCRECAQQTHLPIRQVIRERPAA